MCRSAYVYFFTNPAVSVVQRTEPLGYQPLESGFNSNQCCLQWKHHFGKVVWIVMSNITSNHITDCVLVVQWIELVSIRAEDLGSSPPTSFFRNVMILCKFNTKGYVAEFLENLLAWWWSSSSSSVTRHLWTPPLVSGRRWWCPFGNITHV